MTQYLSLNIEKVENGYIVRTRAGILTGETKIFTSIEDLIQSVSHDILFWLEGRSEYFHGNMYGKITTSISFMEPSRDGKTENTL